MMTPQENSREKCFEIEVYEGPVKQSSEMKDKPASSSVKWLRQLLWQVFNEVETCCLGSSARSAYLDGAKQSLRVPFSLTLG